jgi:prepilin signal peptidase PulO-like enzyme (type II secretory pathway)
MQLVTAFFVFLLGLVFGSFVNVVIYRTLNGGSPLVGRSKCDHCHKKISWYDNIPLLSYALLKGKCRHCKKSISIQYPIIELLTGLLFVWWYAVGFAFFKLTQQPFLYLQPIFWLSVGVLLLIIAITDLVSYIIPDYAVFLLGLAALFYRIYSTLSGVMQPADFWSAIISGLALAAFFSLIILLTKGKGMGWGDVKLAFVMGLILGPQRLIVATFLAFILGALVGLILIFLKRKKFGQILPFGPFLVIGTVLGLIWGNQIWNWYISYLI